MNPCEVHQAQLLEHLYGLLDAAETVKLQHHLEQCVTCRGAQSRAELEQKLFALAARSEFAGVHFEAPVAEPATLPLRRPARVRRNWLRAAVAAALFLAVAGLGGIGGNWYWQGRAKHEQVVQAKTNYDGLIAEAKNLREERETTLNQAVRHFQDTETKVRQLQEQQQQKLVAAAKAAREQQLYMVITGPETVQPGAPNDFHIETKNLNDRPVATQLDARVRDQTGKVVYAETGIHSMGKYRLALPRDLQVKPETKLSLEVAARGEDGAQGKLNEKLPLAQAIYVTHLTTDKPMYQPGEIVHFRSLTLDRFSLKPATEDLQLVFTITNPNQEEKFRLAGLSRLQEQGKLVSGPDQKPVQGIGAGQFAIPDNLPGGEYTVTVSEARHRFQPERRKFIINRYEKPRLNKELEYSQKSYGPGEEVVAAYKVSLAQKKDMPLIGKPVFATLVVDGKQYDVNGKEANPNDTKSSELKLQTDASNSVRVHFRLPTQIERGQASLAVRFEDGGLVETLVRPVPLVLKKLDVEFFPEGGDLVAGVPNGVYFHARTTLGKAADLKGRIVDANGKVMTEAQTLTDADQPGVNQGMGRFQFTPAAGMNYELKIDTPVGMEGVYRLPNVTDGGVGLSIPSGTTTDKEPIRVVVHSADRDRQLLVGAYCRGRLLAHQRVLARKGAAQEVQLQPDSGIGGVYRITVFEERTTAERRQDPVPVAERLIYRQAAGRLNVAIKPDKKVYSPGDSVHVQLSATNENGQPAPAVLLVAVVDKSVITLADEKTARSMPTHFFLTSEVHRPEDLEHADFLLTNHPKAAEALDLLLGTQGWRRFAEQDPRGFQKQHKEEAERLLVMIGQMSSKSVNSVELERQRVVDEFQPQLVHLQEQLLQDVDKLDAAEDETPFLTQQDRLKTASADALRTYQAADREWANYEAASDVMRSRCLLGLGAGLLIVGVLSLLIGVLRNLERALPYLATGVCSIILCGLVLLATFFDRERRESAGNTQVLTAEVVYEREAENRKLAELAREPNADQQPDLEVIPVKEPRQDAKPHAMPLEEKAAAPAPPSPQAPKALKPVAKAAADEVNKGDKLEGDKKDFKGEGPGRGGAKGNEKAKGLDDRADMFKDLGKRQEPQLADGKSKKQAEAARNRRLAGEPAGKEGKGAAEGGDFEQLQKRDHLRLLRNADMPVAAGGAGGGSHAPGNAVLGAIAAGRFIQPQPPCIVREYAHQRVTSGNPNERSDFAETLYWHPAVVLPNGEAQVAFQLCDSVTSFQVLATGTTLDGRLGNSTALIESRLPFNLEPKLPIEVTASDKIDVAVAVRNDTDQHRIVDVRVDPQGLSLLQGSAVERLRLGSNTGTRRVFRFQPSIVEGDAQLLFKGHSEPFATDDIRKVLKVVPEGFPVVGSVSDRLERVALHEITLPARDQWVKGTLKCQLNVYPSTLADLQKGLEALLREPCGCFEQTSTSNYPNLLILNYLQESDQANPEVTRRARELLDRGYQKLTAFECRVPGQNQRRGYEWFGGMAPAHEALTAYGLLQFRDMARIYQVDQTMVQRTQQYLMEQKDGKGGFKRNPRALDTFGRAPEQTTNAYIVWALTEGGKEDDVKKELATLADQAATSTDPYFLALTAMSLHNRDQTDAAVELLRKLAKAQKKEGFFDGAQSSITGSGGRDLQIETTALALLGWLKVNRPEFDKNVEAAARWIGQQRGGYGGFGSTQSTILALKALIDYTKSHKFTPEPGELVLSVGDNPVERLAYKAGASETLTLTLAKPEEHLQPGKNALRVETTSKNAYPYTLSWSYQVLTPPSADQCPVKLSTQLSKGAVNEGDTVQLTAKVENASGKGQGMTVAIIGLPAGLTLPEDMKQLKDMALLRDNGTKPGLISAWETRGRELILYWRDLAPDAKIEVSLDLICRVPGEYRGPASRAYLYYNADHKHWVEPLKIDIAAKVD